MKFLYRVLIDHVFQTSNKNIVGVVRQNERITHCFLKGSFFIGLICIFDALFISRTPATSEGRKFFDSFLLFISLLE